MEIRDPIHGAIRLSPAEIRILDHPLVQRLRGIRQLGFSELTFPGATHTRYLHSVGTMHLAGRAFDAIVENGPWQPPRAERERLRALVRLAALLHDVGHPPLSHTTESVLPVVARLGAIAGYRRDPTARATHEDVTVALVLDNALGEAIDGGFRDAAIDRRQVAALLSERVEAPEAAFVACGASARPLLHQIVSSELDVDRLDYLLRDAYFTGVAYGMADLGWLLAGLTAAHVAGAWHLALDRRALLALEAFLLSRYHMFLAVYFHQRTIIYDYMLKQWFDEQGFEVPVTPEAFVHFDDHDLEMRLRASDSAWARRIVHRDPLRLVRELHGDEGPALRAESDARLAAAGIEALWISSTGTLGKYDRRQGTAARLYIQHPPSPRRPTFVPLHESTDLFHKFEQGYRLLRLYVPPGQAKAARAALEG